MAGSSWAVGTRIDFDGAILMPSTVGATRYVKNTMTS